jgi:hypothetical protein
MAARWLTHLGRLNLHNYATFRRAPLAEISGSLGDLGTLLPLMIALAVQGSIDLGSTLFFSGIFNVLTGLLFGIPLPVQPMKVESTITQQHRHCELTTHRLLHQRPSPDGRILPCPLLPLQVSGWEPQSWS